VYGLIRQVHLYAGLVLALALLALAVTGAALVYKEAYWRAVYPELRAASPEMTPDEIARGVAAAHAAFGDALGNVKLPAPGVSAYHLYLEDGGAFLLPGEHRVLDRWTPHDRLMAFLFDLHAHFLAGETGERVGGFIGLAGAVMAVTGLVLWWPARGRFRLRNLAPQGASRRALLRWHRDLGLVFAPLMLLVMLSGSGVVFYATAGAILNGVFGDSPPAPPEIAATAQRASGDPGLPDAAGVARAMDVFPQARLVFITLPRNPDAPLRYRLKRRCELHPNGRSFVHADPSTGDILGIVDACAAPQGQKALHALYPLHAGKAGSDLYALGVFLSGLALAILSVTGALAWLRRTAKRRRVAAA